MRSIVGSMDSSHSSLNETTTYFQHFIDDMLENGGIEADYKIYISHANHELSTTIRRNLYLVIKEILTNILKHSRATKVKTTILQRDEDLIIKISDNGIGLEKIDSIHFGNGMRNIKKRIGDLNGELAIESDNGTCIKINLKLKI